MTGQVVAGNAAAVEHVTSGDSSVDWHEHEHSAPAIELEAQQLIDHAGSPDLAKQAIDAANHHHVEAAGPADELARELGFGSRIELLAASSSLTLQDGTPWWVTAVEEKGWVVWNEQALAAVQQFASLEALNHYLSENSGLAPL
jgi:hypothetical protein